MKAKVSQLLEVNLTEVDVANYCERLKDIKLDIYNDQVIEVICGLDAFDATDQPRSETLEK